MNPGVTVMPRASIVRSAPAEMDDATSAVCPRATATSAKIGGRPLPSTTVPPRIRRSKLISPPRRISMSDAVKLGDVVVEQPVFVLFREPRRMLLQELLRVQPRGVAV